MYIMITLYIVRLPLSVVLLDLNSAVVYPELTTQLRRLTKHVLLALAYHQMSRHCRLPNGQRPNVQVMHLLHLRNRAQLVLEFLNHHTYNQQS